MNENPTMQKPISIREQLRVEVIQRLARQGISTFFISLVNAGLVYFVLRDYATPAYLWSWVSLIVAFNALRLILSVVFYSLPEDSGFRIWTLLYLTLVYGTGLAWGLLPLFPVFHRLPWVEGFIVFVIAGMAAGGIATLYVMLSAVIPYLLAIIFPLIYTLARGEEPHHFAMSLLVSIFLMLLVRSSYELNRNLRRTIQLEIENRDLFNFLVNAKDSTQNKQSAPGPNRL